MHLCGVQGNQNGAREKQKVNTFNNVPVGLSVAASFRGGPQERERKSF